MKKRTLVFILPLTLFLGCIEGTADSGGPEMIPSIQVRGEGRVETAPDEASVSFGVTSENKSLAKAYRDNTDKMNAVIKSVKGMEIADKDIQTSSYSVSPVYPQDERGRRLPGGPQGFRVSQQLSVKISDLGKLGPLIDQGMAEGTNTFSGIHFSSSRMQELEKEAKRLAAKEARDNASLLAESLGVGLGKLLRVTDEYIRPDPPRMRAMAMMGTADAAGGPQIEAGSLEVVATCHVEYAIDQ